jgi:hypothetical protein
MMIVFALMVYVVSMMTVSASMMMEIVSIPGKIGWHHPVVVVVVENDLRILRE